MVIKGGGRKNVGHIPNTVLAVFSLETHLAVSELSVFYFFKLID